uniref:Uncharacterized protein n=1 Tax=Anguilla anguilla TaxID=7936 RepID=A0A0E9P6M8_ANGAN
MHMLAKVEFNTS